MKKILVFVLVVLSFAIAVPAQAHRASWTFAYSTGRDISRSDCGRAWDWNCDNFPVSGPSVYAVGDHSWDVWTYYQESRIYNPLASRICHTQIRITHWDVVYRGKFC